jgi:hypothetical protein
MLGYAFATLSHLMKYDEFRLDPFRTCFRYVAGLLSLCAFLYL